MYHNFSANRSKSVYAIPTWSPILTGIPDRPRGGEVRHLSMRALTVRIVIHM